MHGLQMDPQSQKIILYIGKQQHIDPKMAQY